MGQACCACHPRGHLRRRHRRGRVRARPRVGGLLVARGRSRGLAHRARAPLLVARCSRSASCVFSGAANLTGGRDLDVSLLFGSANAAEAVIAGLLLKSPPDDRPRLESLDDFLRLRQGVAGGRTRDRHGRGADRGRAFDGGEFLSTWPQVFASHAASTLVIVPVAMSLARRYVAAPDRWSCSPRRWLLFAVTAPRLRAGPDAAARLRPAAAAGLGGAAARRTRSRLAAPGRQRDVHGPHRGRASDRSAPRSRPATPRSSTAGTMVQIWLLSAALMSLPLTVAVEQRRQLLATVTRARGAVPPQLHRVADRHAAAAPARRPARDPGRQRQRPSGCSARTTARWSAATSTGSWTNPSTVRASIAQILAGELDGWHTETGLASAPGTRVNIAVSRC